MSADEKNFVTGGSDSLLIIWVDSTQEKREEALKAQEKIMADEQLLTNLLHNNKLFAALGLALSLDKPFKVLTIIKGQWIINFLNLIPFKFNFVKKK